MPRIHSWETLLNGGDYDVVLCQPVLTLRIQYDEQEPIVKNYFETQSNVNAGLLGDDPYEPNNGLLQLAADLRVRGYSVCVLDFHMLDVWWRRKHRGMLRDDVIKNVIARFRYRLLGISTICVAEKAAAFLAQVSKEIYPESQVVAGGLLPNAIPSLLKERYPAFDELVVGDGLDSICRRINSGKTMSLSSADFSKRAFDLVPAEMPLVPRVTVQRGCALKCAFCSPIRMQHRAVGDKLGTGQHAIEIVDEIKSLRDIYNTKFFVMGDLSFLANSSLDEAVCYQLEKQNLGVDFWCQMRPDCVTAERAQRLKKSGCVQVAIGIENTNRETLRIHQKSYRLPMVDNHLDYSSVLTILREAGLSTYGYFIIGLPGDTEADVLNTIEFMSKLFAEDLLDAAHISVPVAYPGTPWYDNPEHFGIKIRHHDFSNYWMNSDPLGYSVPMMDTDHLKAERIYELWLYALKRVTAHYEKRLAKSRVTRLFNVINCQT